MSEQHTPSPKIDQQQLPSKEPVLTCDGAQLKQLASAALAWLGEHYDKVNSLNVFPVPDGDTGTNMLLTMQSACREIAEIDAAEVGTIADKLAYGAIMGSRGNSGTILSQLFRGFAQAVKGKHSFDAAGIAAGLKQAVKLAYNAVQSPVEGTILTVAREASEEAERAAAESNDLRIILERIVTRAKVSVARTPDLLPILKKAGVVDSGGQGLVYIFEGMLRHVNREELHAMAAAISTDSAARAESTLSDVLRSEDTRGYSYDVQFILRGQNLDVAAVRERIGSMGDSMVVVGDEALIKVHIHVYDPGVPLSYGVSLGAISDIVVENMQAQSEEYIARRESGTTVDSPPDVKYGDIAVVAVAPGAGLARVLRDLGVAIVVSGGQTMNPSTEDLLHAVNKLHTDKILILPNNKNIILAAEQAADLANDPANYPEGMGDQAARRVVVIPTKTVPQGITAMLSFQPETDIDTLIAQMDTARGSVVTGEITTAIRTVEIDGVSVDEGQVIGLVDGKLAVSGDEIGAVVLDLLDRMDARQREVITMFYGDHVTQALANQLAETLRAEYAEQEIDVIEGGQPHYQYIISAE